jgi:DNA-directed RNA polymerase specialized sigma24 family protein
MNQRGAEARRAEAGDAESRRARRRREVAAFIAARAEFLGPDERELMRAVYEEGKTPTDLSRLTGLRPRHIQRRVRRILRRVLSDRFLFVAAQRADWPAGRQRVATAVVLRGLSMRRAAQELGVSIYAVRYHMQAVEAMFGASAHHS